MRIPAHRTRFLLAVWLWVWLTSVPARAQNAVSVRPGLIQHTEGTVLLRDRVKIPRHQNVVHLEEGRRLVTREGRAEVILSAGAILRIGPQSEVDMVRAEVSDIQIQLRKGSCLLDVRKRIGLDAITILAGQGSIRFSKKGLYRIDIPAESPPVVKVFRGAATVSMDAVEVMVRSKHSVVLAGPLDGADTEAFSTKERDEFDRWSQERASVLAQEERSRIAAVQLRPVDDLHKGPVTGRGGGGVEPPLLGAPKSGITISGGQRPDRSN